MFWLLFGLLVGAEHALEADHVAAVTVLVETRSRTLFAYILKGVIWGLGHTLTLTSVGVAALLFKAVIPVSLSKWLELAVGIMLLVLGINLVRNLITRRIHSHTHTHPDGTTHSHIHNHANVLQPQLHEHSHRTTFFVGSLHGLAGSGALIILASAAAPSTMAAFIFLLAVGFGLMIGMACATFVLALIYRATDQISGAHDVIRWASALASIAVGLSLIHGILIT